MVDGSSFVAQYRRRGGRARVIVLTAVGAIDADEIGGAYALVRKPFEIDALLTTVAAALGSSDDVQASGPWPGAGADAPGPGREPRPLEPA